MATVLGNALINVRLDVDAARRQLQALSEEQDSSGEIPARGRRSWDRVLSARAQDADSGQHTTRSAPLRQAFQAAKALVMGNPGQAAQFAGKAMGLTIKALLVKMVIDELEASPKRLAVLKGLFPALENSDVFKFTEEKINGLSDDITTLKARLESIVMAKDEITNLGRAALRLGQTLPAGGSMDLFKFLQQINEQEERMRRRVDKEIDKEVMEKLGDSARLAVNR